MPPITIKQFQNDPYEQYTRKVASAESGGKASAKNPFGAAGLYQFVPSTWRALNDKYKLGYSQDDRLDPEKSKKVMRLFTEENKKQLSKRLGRQPNDYELYLAHGFGASGAGKLIEGVNKNPNIRTDQFFSPIILKQNRSLLYNKDGSAKTLGDVTNHFKQKMSIPATSYTNSEKQITPEETVENLREVNNTLTDLVFTKELPNFTGVSYTPEEDENIKKLEEKQAEKEVVREREVVMQQQPEEEQPQAQEDISEYYVDPNQTYAEIDSFLQMQSGGIIKDNIPQYRRKVEEDASYLSPRQFTEDYILSPMYRQRLISSGYENPDQEIQKRLRSVREANIVRQDGTPSRAEIYYKDFMGEPYSEIGSVHDSSNNSIVVDYATDMSREETIYDNTEDDILAHELGHSEIDSFSGKLNNYDSNQLFDRNRQYQVGEDFSQGDRENMRKLHPSEMPHELSPSESKADMNALRYMLKKENIYDAGTEEFTKEHLDKLPSNYLKDRLRYRYKDEDLIWLMNNIASNEMPETFQRGGQIPTSNLGMWQYPNQTVRVPSPNITMQGINHQILGISEQTGERKIMQPNQNYYFDNTKSIIEIPLKK